MKRGIASFRDMQTLIVANLKLICTSIVISLGSNWPYHECYGEPVSAC